MFVYRLQVCVCVIIIVCLVYKRKRESKRRTTSKASRKQWYVSFCTAPECDRFDKHNVSEINGELYGLFLWVAQWLVRQSWDPKVQSSSAGRCTHVVFLGKPLSQCLSHPGV